MAEVAIALDVPDRQAALALVDRLAEDADFFKVGLELFGRAGPEVVAELRKRGRRVFLDLKLHDIPNTVAAAARAAADLNAELLTVHSAGGPRMIEAARVALEGSRTRLLAVTVLTSLGGPELARIWGRGETERADEVVRLARLATESGAHGIVASALEARLLREHLSRGFLIVTPGIRLAGDGSDDHADVATPAEAARAGADVLVIGRSVTRATAPKKALARVRRELAIA